MGVLMLVSVTHGLVGVRWGLPARISRNPAAYTYLVYPALGPGLGDRACLRRFEIRN